MPSNENPGQWNAKINDPFSPDSQDAVVMRDVRYGPVVVNGEAPV